MAGIKPVEPVGLIFESVGDADVEPVGDAGVEPVGATGITGSDVLRWLEPATSELIYLLETNKLVERFNSKALVPIQ